MPDLRKLIDSLWPRRIRSQLIIGIVGVHLVLMGVFVFDMIRRQKAFLKSQNFEQTMRLVSDYAVNASSFIISDDLDGLERLTRSYQNFPNLRYAMILSSERIVMAHTNSKFVGLKPNDSISARLSNTPRVQTLLENSSMLDVAAPVVQQNRVIGWARVGVSQEYIDENLARIAQSGSVLMLIALIVGVLVAISVSNKLSQGLYKLIHATDQIKGGDRTKRVGNFRSLELARLGTSFNEMLNQISAHERLLEMVLENMPVGVVITDAAGKITSANTAFREIWNGMKFVGIEQYDEFKAWNTSTGKRLMSHEWGAAVVVRTARPVLDQELEIECFDGTRKTILNSAIPLMDQENKLIGAIAINVDITDRKRAEAALVRANHDITERVKELTALYLITEIATDLDRPVDEILQRCVELIPPSYQYPEITSARIMYMDEEFRNAAFESSEWSQTALIKSGSGELLGAVEVFYKQQRPQADEGPFLKEERLMINSVADILGSSIQRRKAEQQLRQSEEKFRSLVEQSLVGIFILQDERFVYANPGFQKISGYSSEELLARQSFLDIVHEDDRAKMLAKYENRMSDEAPVGQYVTKGIRKDGSVAFLELIVTQIIYEDLPAVIGVMVDITGRVEEEKRINKAVNDAQEKERVQIGMELHDNVKQIIAASMINLDFLAMSRNQPETVTGVLGKVKGYLNEAIEEVRRISHQLAPSVDDSLSLFEKIKVLVDNMNVAGELVVRFDIDEFAGKLDNGIQLACYRIIQEQFTNIRKHARAAAVTISVHRHKGYLALDIADDGVGFEMNGKKQGIGLENIRRRAQALNGDMRVISAPGHGCRLTVELPL